MLWIPSRHKMKERMNGRKPHVSPGHAILALLFQVGQERKDSGRTQISQVERRNRLLSADGNETGAAEQCCRDSCGWYAGWFPEGGEGDL
jgi:hypothetical protein